MISIDPSPVLNVSTCITTGDLTGALHLVTGQLLEMSYKLAYLAAFLGFIIGFATAWWKWGRK